MSKVTIAALTTLFLVFRRFESYLSHHLVTT